MVVHAGGQWQTDTNFYHDIYIPVYFFSVFLCQNDTSQFTDLFPVETMVAKIYSEYK